MADILVSVMNGFQMSQSAIPETELVLDAYGSMEQANIYFDNRLRSRPWKKAELAARKSALAEATQLIDRLNFAGCKHQSNQLKQFPRDDDVSVPMDIEKACYEIALKLLDGYDPELEVSNLASTSQGYSSVRDTYNRSFVLDHIRAGIPSSKAWELLKPYLRDPNVVKLSRVD
jgi:hypothetical protein